MAKSENTEKTETALAKLHGQWIANGSKKPSAAEIKALKAEIAAGEKAYEDAVKALEKAQELKQKAAIKTILAMGGKTQLDLGGGVIVAPSCRGDAVYFRRVGVAEVV